MPFVKKLILMLKAVAGVVGIKHFWNKHMSSIFSQKCKYGHLEERTQNKSGQRSCRKGNSGPRVEKLKNT